MFTFAPVASAPIPLPVDLTAGLGMALAAMIAAFLIVATCAIVRDALSFGRAVVRTGPQLRRPRSADVEKFARPLKDPPLAA